MGLVLKIVCFAVIINYIGAEDADRVINIHFGSCAETETGKCRIAFEFLDDYETLLLGNMTALLNKFEQRLKAIVDEHKLRLETILETLDDKIEAIKETTECVPKPIDCEDIQTLGNTMTDVYTIYPNSGATGYSVRCDMDTGTGGWTVLQRRISASDFYKTWEEYENGFGNLTENFWLGNRLIHKITTQGQYELRVDMTSVDGDTAYAEYTEFSLGDAESEYELTVGGYSGNAGDSLKEHNQTRFSTKDRDNDVHIAHCAQAYHGAWWYRACHHSNLNGLYGSTDYAKGPIWFGFKGHSGPMKVTEMKIRRRH